MAVNFMTVNLMTVNLMTVNLMTVNFRNFSEYINYEILARSCENPEAFTDRCSLISDVLQGVDKVFEKYMKVNEFLFLSCSLKK